MRSATEKFREITINEIKYLQFFELSEDENFSFYVERNKIFVGIKDKRDPSWSYLWRNLIRICRKNRVFLIVLMKTRGLFCCFSDKNELFIARVRTFWR
jgi:hypothetical protein